MSDPGLTIPRSRATLVEALPYMRRYAGATFVVKYGGHAMGDAGAGPAISPATSCC